MEVYHKINAPFKRYLDGPQKGKLIMSDWSLPEFAYLAGNQWEYTEKVDGTNIRIHMTRVEDTIFVEYGGRSDNASIPVPLLEYLETTFPTYPSHRRNLTMPSYRDRYDVIGSWMVESDVDDVILFGEGYGPKIQGGGKYRDDHSFVIFDIKIGSWWLKREDVNDIADKLGIEAVPVLGTGTLWDAIRYVKEGWYTLDDALTGNGGPYLKSQWGEFEAEGIVARPTVPLFDRRGDRIICKVKGKDFR